MCSPARPNGVNHILDETSSLLRSTLSDAPGRTSSFSSAHNPLQQTPREQAQIGSPVSPANTAQTQSPITPNDTAQKELREKHQAEQHELEIHVAKGREALFLRHQAENKALEAESKLLAQRKEKSQNYENDVARAQQQLAEEETKITRDAIREQQKYEAKLLKEQHDTLLKQFLPAYAFAKDPKLTIHKDPKENDRVPSILAQQVARAQANAELNIYLSFIPNAYAKATFLTEYSAIKNRISQKSTLLMKKFATQEWRKAGEPMHEPKTRKTGQADTGMVRRSDERRYPVNKLPPMLPEGLKGLQRQVEDLEEKICLLRVSAARAENHIDLMHQY